MLIAQISSILTDKIEPKRYAKRELLKALPSETMIIARASVPDNNIESMASEYIAKLSLKNSITRADNIATITAIHSGLYQSPIQPQLQLKQNVQGFRLSLNIFLKL